jgi:hypothetical protein
LDESNVDLWTKPDQIIPGIKVLVSTMGEKPTNEFEPDLQQKRMAHTKPSEVIYEPTSKVDHVQLLQNKIEKSEQLLKEYSETTMKR